MRSAAFTRSIANTSARAASICALLSSGARWATAAFSYAADGAEAAGVTPTTEAAGVSDGDGRLVAQAAGAHTSGSGTRAPGAHATGEAGCTRTGAAG